MDIALLRNVPLFRELGEAELQTVAPLFAERTVKRNTILFLEGGEGDELYIIKTGIVRIYRLEQAKEITLALFHSGDFFGEMAVIQQGFTRSAIAETLEKTTLYALNRSDFYRFIERTPRLAMRLLEVTMNRLRHANDQIYALTFLDVRSRIMRNIKRLAEEYGVSAPDGLLVDLKLTHQQLANLVGTVRESVTKILQDLQDEGIIKIESKKIVILKPDCFEEY